MSKKIIIDANFPNETRVVLLSHNNNIEDIEYETSTKQQYKGNIYLAKITRVEPSLQAAFIDYGTDKSGFLPFSEIHPDYYNIPISDKKPAIDNLQEIPLPDITPDDIEESTKSKAQYNPLIDSDEIDLKAIEKLVDEKIQTDFNLEVLDSDIEPIAPEREAENKEKQYKIQEVIKKGQVILVQVTKEERGNKGASFTTYISLAGKYCVLMPNTAEQNGVSRKISAPDERKRLKTIISKVTDNSKNSASIIVRTAGIGSTTLDIKRDYDYLARLWNKIRESTLKSLAPCFIHEEDGIIQKTIRDMCDHNVKELIIQGNSAYQNALRLMKDMISSDISKLKEYRNKVPIFTKFGIEEQLAALYQPNVPLPSGGYIVINPTEALISIDVNSGKATSERNIEETALKTNLEAAKEIARQIKLRDLSGLLVIDFIDMYETRNRKIVERSFKEFLSRDRARIQTANISQFGLLEMSRQRLRQSFLEVNSSICSYCNGKGLVRADESNAMLILRTVENEIFNENVSIVNVFANSNTVIYLLNNKRKEISLIEEKYSLKLQFYVDPSATSDNYAIEKIKLSKKVNSQPAAEKPAIQKNSSHYQDNNSDKDNKHKQKWRVATKQQDDVTQHNSTKDLGEQASASEENDSTHIHEEQAQSETIIANNDNAKQKLKPKRKYINKRTNYSRQAKASNHDEKPKSEKGNPAPTQESVESAKE